MSIQFVLFVWTRRTLILKPFMAYEVLVCILDYARVYLIAGLGFRNPIGLVLLGVAYIVIVWMIMLIFNTIVLRSRKDLRISASTLVLFPFYKVSSQCSYCFQVPLLPSSYLWLWLGSSWAWLSGSMRC